MINVGAYTSPFRILPSLGWKDEESLVKVLEGWFGENCARSYEKPRWPYLLNLYRLERLGRFHIMWSSDIQDHLYLDEDDYHNITVTFYHHCAVLKAGRESISGLPNGLYEETLRTIELLIPCTNQHSQSWFTTQVDKIKKTNGKLPAYIVFDPYMLLIKM
jgi:hypothetical protein